VTEKLNPMELAAIEAAQPVPESWRPYYFDKKENGILIQGCETTFFKKGARKGAIKYLITESNKTVLVTPEMSLKFENV
jgi:hypothetical protein